MDGPAVIFGPRGVPVFREFDAADAVVRVVDGVRFGAGIVMYGNVKSYALG